MYQNNPLRVATGEVRISYAHLNEPYANPMSTGQTPKYSATLLIPKTDLKTKAEIDSAIKAAYEKGVKDKWKGARPHMNSPLIHDGDGLRTNGTPFGPECKGCWVITASTGKKPWVCHFSNVNAQLPEQEVYSGMYAVVTLSFYNPSQGNPVACSLDNVYKTKDGEPLSGGPSAQSDAAGLDFSAYMRAPEEPPQPQGYGYPQSGYAPQGQTRVNPLTGEPLKVNPLTGELM